MLLSFSLLSCNAFIAIVVVPISLVINVTTIMTTIIMIGDIFHAVLIYIMIIIMIMIMIILIVIIISINIIVILTIPIIMSIIIIIFILINSNRNSSSRRLHNRCAGGQC